MPNYIVNTTKQYDQNGRLYYEVHQSPKSNCTSPNYPASHNQSDLGGHVDCHSAVRKAKSEGYTNADGCYYCCKPCHSR